MNESQHRDIPTILRGVYSKPTRKNEVLAVHCAIQTDPLTADTRTYSGHSVLAVLLLFDPIRLRDL